MTDDRGRVLGLMDLYCTSEEKFLVLLEGVDGEWFQERYGMYIVFDDVEMKDLSGERHLLSIQGPAATQAIGQALGEEPSPLGHQVLADVEVLARDRTGDGGWDLLGTIPVLQALKEHFQENGTPLGSPDELNARRVHAGLPSWPADRGGQRSFVHELRLRNEVCSFNKGCYVGQEVINRMDTMGKLTRQLQGLQVDGDAPPPLGTPIHLNGEVVGAVGSTAIYQGQIEALAVLRKKAWSPGTVVDLVLESGTQQATVCKLPFP